MNERRRALNPNSTNSICCGLAGQQVVQQTYTTNPQQIEASGVCAVSMMEVHARVTSSAKLSESNLSARGRVDSAMPRGDVR